MIYIVIGLISVMSADILLGSSIASLKSTWNKKKFISGIVKALFIIIGCSLMYLCSYLNPNIVVVNIGDVNMNLISSLHMLFISGIIMYGTKDVKKLALLLNLDVDINEDDDVEGVG